MENDTAEKNKEKNEFCYFLVIFKLNIGYSSFRQTGKRATWLDNVG